MSLTTRIQALAQAMGGQLKAVRDGAVRHDSVQALTTLQKAQARSNIGAQADVALLQSFSTGGVAMVVLTLPPGYDEYELRATDVQSANGGSNLFMRLSTDAGASFHSAPGSYAYAGRAWYLFDTWATDGNENSLESSSAEVRVGVAPGFYTGGTFRYSGVVTLQPTGKANGLSAFDVRWGGSEGMATSTTRMAGVLTQRGAAVNAIALYAQGSAVMGEFRLYGFRRNA